MFQKIVRWNPIYLGCGVASCKCYAISGGRWAGIWVELLNDFDGELLAAGVRLRENCIKDFQVLGF